MLTNRITWDRPFVALKRSLALLLFFSLGIFILFIAQTRFTHSQSREGIRPWTVLDDDAADDDDSLLISTGILQYYAEDAKEWTRGYFWEIVFRILTHIILVSLYLKNTGPVLVLYTLLT